MNPADHADERWICSRELAAELAGYLLRQKIVFEGFTRWRIAQTRNGGR